jgi:hypothetical protein
MKTISLRTLNYVEKNPVKAGLVADAADWPFSSAHHRDPLRVWTFRRFRGEDKGLTDPLNAATEFLNGPEATLARYITYLLYCVAPMRLMHLTPTKVIQFRFLGRDISKSPPKLR